MGRPSSSMTNLANISKTPDITLPIRPGSALGILGEVPSCTSMWVRCEMSLYDRFNYCCFKYVYAVFLGVVIITVILLSLLSPSLLLFLGIVIIIIIIISLLLFQSI